VLALVTAIVSAIFAAAVAVRYARSRRIALLFWAVGLAMFSVAALAGAYDRAQLGTAEANYRVFYLFGAISNVAWLALGTVALVAPRFTRAAFVAVLALTLIAIYPVFALPVDPRAAHDNGRGFADGSLPRILAAIGSGVGSLVLFGGALWSAWVFLRRRHNGRRALSNVVIAVGVLIIAFGGTVTFTGASGILEVTNLVGVSVMFAGFLIA
jgi:hypothetical protein